MTTTSLKILRIQGHPSLGAPGVPGRGLAAPPRWPALTDSCRGSCSATVRSSAWVGFWEQSRISRTVLSPRRRRPFARRPTRITPFRILAEGSTLLWRQTHKRTCEERGWGQREHVALLWVPSSSAHKLPERWQLAGPAMPQLLIWEMGAFRGSLRRVPDERDVRRCI